jgi:putative sigma-54 modulation protein
MKFEYTGRHLDVTEALRTHVENHFDKLAHLFDGSATGAHVIIEVEKGRHRSEIVVNWRDHVLTATSTLSDMYKSLSQTIDKIEKQATRLHDKVIDKHQKRRKPEAGPDTDTDTDSGTDNSPPRIISSQRYVVKPMTPDEAALRLETEKNQFVVFRDAEDEKISILYQRSDGNLGLIRP